MLNGISPLISPELLKVLCEMGHGDEIVLADVNFPAEAIARDTAYGKAIRLDGTGMVPLLEGILPLFPLDSYDENNFRLMEVVPGDPVDTPIWGKYQEALDYYQPGNCYSTLERFAYYDRARKAYAVVITGETAQYANIILKKGVVLPK